MATLVLSTVGTILGGPIGGALGSLVGQAVDQQLFGAGPRRGPRLGDLSIQTSSFGTPIPRIFGTMRVAGTVVWATDLKEEETVEGGGKSGPEVVSYAYSASFAVALSSRPALRVRRIWADGKLLRGAAGDFKVECKFRFHSGSEGQAVDPLIASIEGTGKTPAFRGLALAVFEDLALVEYGNRIPMLTFELVADDEQISLGTIAGDVSRGLIQAGDGTATVAGFAAYGADQRSAIADLIDVWGLSVVETRLRQPVDTDGEIVSIAGDRERGCAVDGGERETREQRSQQPARALPASLTLNYYDPSRDYQGGQMRASVDGGGRGQWRVDCPVVIEAATAKQTANDAMARRWAERDRLKVNLAPEYVDLRPGEQVELAGIAGRWLVDEATIDGLVVKAELRRMTLPGPTMPADPGRPVQQQDQLFGTTDLALFDLPDLGLDGQGGLSVALAASADGAFKPVPVAVTANQQPLPSINLSRRAVLGRSLGVLGAGTTVMLDLVNTVEVQLTSSDQLLLNADDDALAMGGNLILLGDELLQFGQAEEAGPGRFRLSRLLRGRRGTEWAVGAHLAGERALVIDRATLGWVPLDPAIRGATIEAVAFGIADDSLAPPVATIAANGEALRPVSPCQLTVESIEGGALSVGWLPRCSQQWAWVDGAGDCPLDGRSFEVTMAGPSGTWSGQSSATLIEIGPEVLGIVGTGETGISVTETGAGARSRPVTATWAIG